MQPLFQAHGGNLAWAASLAGCSPREILDFSASISPLGTPPSAIAAIQAHLGDLAHYPDPDCRELCQVLSEVHAVSPEWILPGNGSAELLTWASRELAELSSTYLITPAFGDYLRSLKAFGAKVIRCPILLEGQAVLPKSLLDFSEAIGSKATGLLLNNPHNPTGRLFAAEAILPLLDRFALVVIDEAFMDFLLPEQQQSLIDRVADYPNLVILRSLTKFYGLAGLRLGYAIAHPDRLRRWRQWRDPWSVNVLAAAAGVAGLRDMVFQRRTWAWLAEAHTPLFEGLAALPGLDPIPSAVNYFLVRSERSAVELQMKLLQASRILIRDCRSFPELGDRFFRVAVRTVEENRLLLRGLAEV
ncbi:MAG TPA: threonine-phosphate decarboxylase CobD [Coleofasciculaceae cyanobacterium]